MTFFSPRFDVLPEGQRKIWPDLRQVKESGFVLFGGTAIALYLGHRESVDFDFFASAPLDKRRVQEFSVLQKGAVLVDEANTLIFRLPSAGDLVPVKLAFYGDIPFAEAGGAKSTSDGVLRVASLKTLMTTKLKVLLERVEAKDYVDIDALISHGISLETGLKTAQRIFGKTFQPSEALKALIYFQHQDLDQLSNDVKKRLIKAVRSLQE